MSLQTIVGPAGTPGNINKREYASPEMHSRCNKLSFLCIAFDIPEVKFSLTRFLVMKHIRNLKNCVRKAEVTEEQVDPWTCVNEHKLWLRSQSTL